MAPHLLPDFRDRKSYDFLSFFRIAEIERRTSLYLSVYFFQSRGSLQTVQYNISGSPVLLLLERATF